MQAWLISDLWSLVTGREGTLSTRGLIIGAVVVAFAFLVGCADRESLAAPEEHALKSITKQVDVESPYPELVRSPTEALTGKRPQRLSQRIAQQVPAFGGGFVADGILHVHLADMAATAQVQSVIANEMRRGGRADLTKMQFHQAKYTFHQLEGWHGQLSSSAGIRQPILYTEIDERENRIRIGIESADAEAAIRAELAEKQVPAEAVIFRVDTRPVPAVHLRDRIRPTRAGTQTRATYSGAPDNLVCTHGPNVWYNERRHMVTNSHCTQDVDVYGWGGYTGAIIHQPNLGPWYMQLMNLVGKEVRDPDFYHQWYCDPNQATQGCRWSDAALVEIATTDWDFAGISRPTDRVFLPSLVGSINVNSTFPRIGLVDTWWQGDQLDKVGRTTGWTSGTVVSTCRTVYLQSNKGTYGFLCSGVVEAGGGTGDSGSPVFQFTSTGTELAGIMFAVRPTRREQVHGEWALIGPEFIFSRWEEVDWELGWGGLRAVGNP